MNDITNLLTNLSINQRKRKNVFNFTEINDLLKNLDVDCVLKFTGDINTLKGLVMFTEQNDNLHVYVDKSTNILYIEDDLLEQQKIYSQNDPVFPIYYKDSDGVKHDGYFIKNGVLENPLKKARLP